MIILPNQEIRLVPGSYHYPHKKSIWPCRNTYFTVINNYASKKIVEAKCPACDKILKVHYSRAMLREIYKVHYTYIDAKAECDEMNKLVTNNTERYIVGFYFNNVEKYTIVTAEECGGWITKVGEKEAARFIFEHNLKFLFRISALSFLIFYLFFKITFNIIGQ